MKTSEEMSKSVLEKVRAYEVHKAAVRKRITAVSVTASVLAVCIFAGVAATGNLRMGKAADTANKQDNQYEFSEETALYGENTADEAQNNTIKGKGGESAESGIGNDMLFCSHTFDYHKLGDGWFIEYVNDIEPNAADKFIELFQKTEDFNLRFFMDYFGIPKEDFLKIVDMDYIIENSDYYDLDYYNPDNWFSDDYYKNPLFVQEGKTAPEENSVIIRPEDDTIHTDRYFTICESLIDFVGEEEFNKFKAKYAGTEDFNILNFIKEFNISKEDFKTCTETQLFVTYGIYNTDYVYGTEEMQKEYFEKHILTAK